MATKKLPEDMAGVKKPLNFMSEEISSVAKQQIGLLDLLEEGKQLKAIIKEKEKLKSLKEELMISNNILGWMTC